MKLTGHTYVYNNLTIFECEVHKSRKRKSAKNCFEKLVNLFLAYFPQFGTTVFCGAEIEMEKYQIERIVGRGAYGTVYLCKTISEGTFVIIKQIPMDQMSPTDRQVWLFNYLGAKSNIPIQSIMI